jgi:hypothetical protein
MFFWFRVYGGGLKFSITFFLSLFYLVFGVVLVGTRGDRQQALEALDLA